MTQPVDKVAMIDRARTTGDFYDLELWFQASFRSYAADKPEIVLEALREVDGKMRKGVLSIIIAADLRGILGTCAMRVRRRNNKSDTKLAKTDEEQFQDVLIDAAADPALVFERMEDLKEKIAALAEMSRTNPQQFAVLQADYHDKNVVEHLDATLGTNVSPEYGRKLRERGKKTFEKELKRIQKDAPQ
jgi:hypothetical protein